MLIFDIQVINLQYLVQERNCNTEEGGCFGNAEAPDDDHCNPAHVWNFSFLVCP